MSELRFDLPAPAVLRVDCYRPNDELDPVGLDFPDVCPQDKVQSHNVICGSFFGPAAMYTLGKVLSYCEASYLWTDGGLRSNVLLLR